MDTPRTPGVDTPGQSHETAPSGIPDISQINSLDTARMALRWALERLSFLEKAKGDHEAKTAMLSTALAAAEKEGAAAKSLLAEREQYWNKVDELSLLDAEGKATAEALARREAEFVRVHDGVVAALKKRLAMAEDAARRAQAMTENREATLTEREKAWLREKEELITRHQAAARASERASDLQKAKLASELSAARERHQQQTARLLELERRATEAEEGLAQAQALAESSKPFLAEQERQLNRQRAELERRIRAFEADERERTDEALKRAGASWAEERAQFLDEIELWRQKHRTQVTNLLDLERRVMDAEETARRHERLKPREPDLSVRERRLEERARELSEFAQALESRLPEAQG
ncbi:MAG: hypothetical protein HY927_08475 [Elusimicrobia bacterium]|nr:hypothetical protein [Elusimicrobiota bacterium]